MFSFLKVFKYLWPQIKKHKISFVLVFVAYAIGVSLDAVIKPYIYKLIIDVFISGNSSDLIVEQVTKLAIIMCFIIITYVIAFRTGDFANAYFESKVMKDLHDTTFNNLLTHSYHFFSSNFSGSIVAKAKRFSRSFETFFDVVGFQVWFSFVSLIGILVVLFIQAPIIATVFLVWSIIYIFITLFFISKKVPLDQEESAADSLVTGKLADAILNILNIKIFSKGKVEQNNFEKVTADEEKKRRRAWNFGNMQNLAQAVLMSILQAGILFLNIHLWKEKVITVGTIVLIQVYLIGLLDILWGLGRSITKALKALTDMKEIVDILDQVPDIRDPKNPEMLRMREGSIVFDFVSFEYKEGSNVFENIIFEIKPGERVGLVGHSGAGKSTITKLLLRFTDVTNGRILIDGQDIRSVTQDDLRSVISYVPQESILFHRTIGENIAYSKQAATKEEIITVAKKAHADEFISKLHKGYDTLVGERGVKLSGGERQRVAIARAMLKDSPILVLDEATSSLDSISESYIQDAFNELMKGKTTLVIAHRLSTVQKMDRIIVLDKGKIVEEGTHKELLEKKGFYADLWEHQTGGFLE